MKTLVLTAALMLCLVSCKTISPEAEEKLAAPVNCATAKQDIAALEAEKASAAKRVASGVRMVVPAAAVLGILGRDYGNRAEVASGKYNDDIEAKVAEIKGACAL